MNRLGSLAAALIFSAQAAAAAVPQRLNYQGKLANAAGDPLTGTYSFRFKLFAAETGGAALFTEPVTGADAVSVVNGIYTVQIGSYTAGGIPYGVFEGPDLYLEIDVNAGTTLAGAETLSPRERLNAAAWAVHALGAERLGTGAVIATFTATGALELPSGSTIAAAGTLTLSTAASAASTGDPALFISRTGEVGVGTSQPGTGTVKLRVAGNLQVDNELVASAPTAANDPSYTFMDDNDSGMYQPAVDQVAFAAGGVEALRLRGLGGTAYALATSSGINVGGGPLALNAGGFIRFPDGTSMNSAGSGGNFVARTGDTMTGQLTIAGSSLSVVHSGNTQGFVLAATSATDRSSYHLYVATTGGVAMGRAGGPAEGSRLDVAGPLFVGGTPGSLFLGGGGWPYSIGVGWNGQDSTLRFNAVGTGGGTADFRDTWFYDGKTNPIAAFDGSTARFGVNTTGPQSDVDVFRPAGAGSYPTFRLSDGNVTLPDYSGSSSVGEVSLSNAVLQIKSNRGGSGTNATGGALFQGFTEAGVNNWVPLHLVGTHGGTAPTSAAVTISGQKHSGTNNRSALAGAEPVLDVETNYGGTLLMRVEGGGRVGVGVAAPAARLHVSSTGAVGADKVLVVSSGAAAGQELLTVRGDGKVGVGSAAPAGLLSIMGTDPLAHLYIANAAGAQLLRVQDVGGYARLRGAGGSFIDLADIAYVNGLWSYGAMTGEGNVNLSTAAGVYRTGVGTGSPGAKLHVVAPPADPYALIVATGGLSAEHVMTISSGGTVYAKGGVGVGTASPASKLHVLDGDIRVSTSAGQASRGIVFQDGSVQLTAAGSSQWAASADDIYATNAGQVGIGIAAPTESLHIYDRSGTAGRANLLIEASAENAYLNMQADAWTANPSATLVKQGSTGLLKLNNAGSSAVDHLVVDGQGRVGVGAVPAARLHVSSANAVGADTLLLVSSGTTAGQELLVVKGDGKVGIGGANPGYALDVFRRGDAAIANLQGGGDAWNYSGFNLWSDEATDKYWGLFHRKAGGEANNLLLEEFDGTAYKQRMVMKPDGTSSFTNSTTKTQFELQGAGDAFNYTSFIFYNNDWTKYWAWLHRKGAGEVSSFYLEEFDGTAYNARIAFKPGGNVGLGTTDPIARLHVSSAGAVAADKVLVVSSGAAAAQELLTVRGDGKVGVGTASPGRRLDVSYSESVLGGVGLAVTNNGTAGASLNLISAPAGGRNWDIYSGGAANGTNGSLGIYDRTVGLHRMIVDPAGNVGVETIYPAARLHVSSANAVATDTVLLASSGTATAQELLIIKGDGKVGVGTANPGAKLDVSQGAAGQMGARILMPLAAENTQAGIRIKGYSPAIELMDKDNVQNWYMGIDDNDANKLLIGRGYGPGQGVTQAVTIDASDKVGIGTASPSTLFHVVGSGIEPAYITTSGSDGLLSILSLYGSGGTDREFYFNNAGAAGADGAWGGPADYAEYFHSKDETLKPGELVCVAGANEVGRCAAGGTLIGVVSTKPGVLGVYAEDATDALEAYAKDPHWVQVGLMGQIPTRVSVKAGKIRAGDQLTAGPGGRAVKGASPRTLLIVALEDAEADGVIRALVK